MLDLDIIKKLQTASIEERIQTIEIILQSLKNDLKNTSKPTSSPQPFQVRQYKLGADVTVNREQIYGERNQ